MQPAKIYNILYIYNSRVDDKTDKKYQVHR